MAGTLAPPPPGFVPPTIAQSLARGFGEDASFYLNGDAPMALWADMDYAEDWSSHPIREIHPFVPVLYGKEISEAEFRERVMEIHGIGKARIGERPRLLPIRQEKRGRPPFEAR
jgi:hypothetical protein